MSFQVDHQGEARGKQREDPEHRSNKSLLEEGEERSQGVQVYRPSGAWKIKACSSLGVHLKRWVLWPYVGLGGTHTPPCFFVPSFLLGFTLPMPSLQSFVLASRLACSQAQRDVHMQAGNSAIRPRYGKATEMKG